MTAPEITMTDRLHIEAMIALINAKASSDKTATRLRRAGRLLNDLRTAGLATMGAIDGDQTQTITLTIYGITASGPGEAFGLLHNWAQLADATLHSAHTLTGDPA